MLFKKFQVEQTVSTICVYALGLAPSPDYVQRLYLCTLVSPLLESKCLLFREGSWDFLISDIGRLDVHVCTCP